MRRALGSLQMPWFGAVAVMVSLVVRASAAWGQTAQRYPDSVGYESFSFLSRTDRPWPIPLVFALAGSDTARVIIHVTAGTVAWGALAWVLSRTVRWQRSAFVAVLLVGLSPQIIRYDVAILSESLSITFVVMAIASTLHRLHSRTATATVWCAVSLTLCVLSRPTHLLIAVVCATPVVWKFLRSKGNALSVGGVGFLALLFLGVFTVQQSQHMSVLNLYTVVTSRVLSDDQRFEWFINNGMPDIAGMRQATGYDYATDLPKDVANIVQLPSGQQPPSLMRVGGVELATWMQDHGWTTVAKYLATHPKDTVQHAQQLADATLTPPNGDFLPLQNGPMLPWSTFLTWQLWSLVFVASWGVLALKQTTRRLSVALLAMFLTTWLVYLATVHTSGIEHVRHSSVVAVALRVLGLAALLSILPRRQLSRTLDEIAE